MTNDLRNRVALAITNAEGDDPGLTSKELDAAIRVVLEAAKQEAMRFPKQEPYRSMGTSREDIRANAACRDAAWSIASMIDGLMPKDSQ